MKHRIITIIIAIAILTISTSATFAATPCKWKCKTRKHTTSVYFNNHKVCKMKTPRKLKCKVMNANKVNAKILRHRKNKYVLIEKVEWTPTDKLGNARTTSGYYINYDYDADVEYVVGKTYTSYFIYGNNNYIDDIVKRIDITN